MSADPAALLAALELLGSLRTFAAFEAAFFDVFSFLAIGFYLLSINLVILPTLLFLLTSIHDLQSPLPLPV